MPKHRAVGQALSCPKGDHPMDLTTVVTSIGEATGDIATIGLAVLGVGAALLAFRYAKRALGA